MKLIYPDVIYNALTADEKMELFQNALRALPKAERATIRRLASRLTAHIRESEAHQWFSPVAAYELLAAIGVLYNHHCNLIQQLELEYRNQVHRER